MDVINVPAELRTEIGKAANKKLRSEGLIPAVLYGSEEPQNLTLTHNNVKHLIYTPDFKIAKLDVDGAPVEAIVKDIQFHPVTDSIEHIDFLRLTPGTKVKVNIPVRFKGVSPGVLEGGKLMVQMRKVTILTTPEDMIDEVYADISNLNLGDTVRVEELEISDKIQILTPPANPVGLVEIPRVLRSAEAEELEAAEAEAAEGEGGEGAPAGDDAKAEK